MNAELKQIMEQLTNHEKEYGSREFVLNEFVRRKGDYDRAKEEVLNSTKSLHVSQPSDLTMFRFYFQIPAPNSIFSFNSLVSSRFD